VQRIFAGIGEVARHHATAQPLGKIAAPCGAVSGITMTNSSPP